MEIRVGVPVPPATSLEPEAVAVTPAAPEPVPVPYPNTGASPPTPTDGFERASTSVFDAAKSALGSVGSAVGDAVSSAIDWIAGTLHTASGYSVSPEGDSGWAIWEPGRQPTDPPLARLLGAPEPGGDTPAPPSSPSGDGGLRFWELPGSLRVELRGDPDLQRLGGALAEALDDAAPLTGRGGGDAMGVLFGARREGLRTLLAFVQELAAMAGRRLADEDDAGISSKPAGSGAPRALAGDGSVRPGDPGTKPGADLASDGAPTASADAAAALARALEKLR